MKNLRIGVVGAGMIGSLHARIHYENPQVELAAIADFDQAICDSLSSQYGCQAYTDYHKMLEQENLDLLDICVPEGHHREPAVAAAEAGLKAIFIEKPIAINSSLAEDIIKACDASGTRIMVGHVLKFDPRYVQLKTAIEKGELGEISSLFLKRITPSPMAERLGGKVSIFYYLGVHDIEYMIDYAGANPVRVYAQSTNKKNAAYDALDTVFALITFDNGIIGNLELSWGLPKNAATVIHTMVEAIGTKGMGVVNIEGAELKITSESGPIYSPDTLHWPEFNGRIQGDLPRELQHFVEASASGSEYLVDTQSALKAVKVIEACFASMKTGEAVSV